MRDRQRRTPPVDRAHGFGRPRRAAGRFRGFTLIETALTTIIVGVGVLALMSAQQAFHQKNHWSSHANTALQLGNEIREMCINLPRHDPVYGTEFWGPEPNELWVGDYDDLDDFDGTAGAGMTFSASAGNGPLNARREVIQNMVGWEQIITVENVEPLDITTGATEGSTTMVKMQVVVRYQGPTDPAPEVITTVSWISPN
jgi:hypothetical protein